QRRREIDERIVARLKLRRAFAHHRLARVESVDLRVRVELIEELVDAARFRDGLIDGSNALTLRQLLRLEQEVAEAGAIAGRLDRFLRACDRLVDARPVALLESRLAIDVRFRPLEAEAI